MESDFQQLSWILGLLPDSVICCDFTWIFTCRWIKLPFSSQHARACFV